LENKHAVSYCSRDRRVAVALLSLLLAADAAFAQQAAKPKTSAAVSAQPKSNAAADSKCIGVISTIGDTLFLRKMGITVFGNEQNTAPVDSAY
jgi:hypothetical protein